MPSPSFASPARRALALALAIASWTSGGVPLAAAAAGIALAPTVAPDDDALATATPDARWTIDWTRARRDAQGRPYAVVDKRGARLHVFDGDGRLAGATAVLTGLARGDGAVPGLGRRPVAPIRPVERTTPAGRFESRPGRHLQGEAVVWIDDDAGIAIHRLRPGASEATRARSLASATPDDNRRSCGCVVVPPAFFDAVVRPVPGRGPGVVHVLPDERSAAAMFEPAAGGAARAALASR